MRSLPSRFAQCYPRPRRTCPHRPASLRRPSALPRRPPSPHLRAAPLQPRPRSPSHWGPYLRLWPLLHLRPLAPHSPCLSARPSLRLPRHPLVLLAHPASSRTATATWAQPLPHHSHRRPPRMRQPLQCQAPSLGRQSRRRRSTTTRAPAARMMTRARTTPTLTKAGAVAET